MGTSDNVALSDNNYSITVPNGVATTEEWSRDYDPLSYLGSPSAFGYLVAWVRLRLPLDSFLKATALAGSTSCSLSWLLNCGI